MSSTPHPVSPRPARYSGVAILLHWVLGIALIAIFGLGLYMTGLPFSPQRLKLYNWHKWAGVCFLLLTVLRVVWRVTHRPPALPQTVTLAMPGWQKGCGARWRPGACGLVRCRRNCIPTR